MDYSLPGSFVHGIFQTRILEWAAIHPPGHLPNPGIEPMSLVSPAFADGFFTTAPPGKPKVSTVPVLLPAVTQAPLWD